MAVTKQVFGGVILWSGTAAEVAAALDAEHVPENKIKIFYNGTNVSALIKQY